MPMRRQGRAPSLTDSGHAKTAITTIRYGAMMESIDRLKWLCSGAPLGRATRLCRGGIWMSYKGDEVMLSWGWFIGQGYVLSLMSGGSFKSLAALDAFWDDYFEEM